MKRRIVEVSAVLALACLLVDTGYAQVTMAAIRGKATDDQGAVLPGATVTARHVATNTTKVAVTTDVGQYYLPNLPAGEYEVSIELVGFGTIRRTGIVLQVGQEVGLDFQLTLGTVQETVTVVGDAGLVETTRSGVASVIKKEQIDDLPVVERDFSSLALLAPGVSTGTGGYGAGGTGESLSFNGQRAFTNGVFIDGASAMWQFYGKQASTFPQDWVQEFQVLTNSFGAEFGTASGGIMNVISRSGSNTLSGRAYGFFRDSSLDSAPYAGRFVNGEPEFLAEPAPLSQQRWGGFLGGPIVRNKIFFFVGNENLNTEGTDVLGISEYWRQRGEATVIDRNTTDHPFIVKGDMNLGTKHRASLRFDRSYNIQTNQGGALQVLSSRQVFGGPVWTVVGGFTSTLSNAAFNEVRASYLSNHPPIICNQAGTGGSALLELGPPGTFARRNYPGATFGCGFTGLEAEEDLFISDTFSFLFGRHQMKVGATAAQVRTIIDSLNVRNGAWTFPTDLAFDINNPNSYPDRWSGGLSIPNYNKPAWGFGAFAQDSWNVRDDLTLNLGIRYDVDRANMIANEFIDAKNAGAGAAGRRSAGVRAAQFAAQRIAAYRSGLAPARADAGPRRGRRLLRHEPQQLCGDRHQQQPSRRELGVADCQQFAQQPVLERGGPGRQRPPATRVPRAELPLLAGPVARAGHPADADLDQRHQGAVHLPVLRRHQLPVAVQPDARRRRRVLPKASMASCP